VKLFFRLAIARLSQSADMANGEDREASRKFFVSRDSLPDGPASRGSPLGRPDRIPTWKSPESFKKSGPTGPLLQVEPTQGSAAGRPQPEAADPSRRGRWCPSRIVSLQPARPSSA
jgi:hypothetical protein